MWTYSGDPKSSELDYYRFMLSDTDEDEQLLHDTEIQYVIDTKSDENSRLYLLFDRISVMFDRQAVNSKLGPESEDTTARADYFRERMNYYKKLVSTGGTPTYFQGPDKSFKKGLFENA